MITHSDPQWNDGNQYRNSLQAKGRFARGVSRPLWLGFAQNASYFPWTLDPVANRTAKNRRRAGYSNRRYCLGPQHADPSHLRALILSGRASTQLSDEYPAPSRSTLPAWTRRSHSKRPLFPRRSADSTRKCNFEMSGLNSREQESYIFTSRRSPRPPHLSAARPRSHRRTPAANASQTTRENAPSPRFPGSGLQE